MDKWITVTGHNWVLWVAGLFALVDMFRWGYGGIEWICKTFGIETRSMRRKKEQAKRLTDVEKSIEEIKDTSKKNVAMFLEHEQAVVGKITGIKDEIVDEFAKLREKIDDQQAESEAKAARMRIQRFADELYGDIRHSKEHFDLILMDITAYNHYCDTHPGFVNEKTKFAQEIIADRYEQCLRDHTFRG